MFYKHNNIIPVPVPDTQLLYNCINSFYTEFMSSQKNSGFKVSYNAPVTLTFVLLCITLFALDFFAFKGKLITKALTCHGKIGSAVAFNFKNPFDYIRLFSHVFGNTSWPSLFINLGFILLLGPTLEERYGSPIVALAIAITALVTGVLNVCFLSTTLTGTGAIVLLMIILASVSSLDKKELPLTFVCVLILYCANEMHSAYRDSTLATKGFGAFFKINVPTFINLAGGICGSLFGFLVAPKKSRINKRDIHDEDTIAYSESAVKRPSSNKRVSHKDETVVGEITL